ncbi:MAG: hypothetical protein KGL39_52625, partial [Patescibacteria group bacterium]|nr:hypothetical protein [Patescibacteria group bacterium]
ESAPLALLNEWLAGYFDGAAHTVGSTTGVVFPKANRAFGQGAPQQPLHKWRDTDTDVEIRVLMFPRGELATPLNTQAFNGKLVMSQVQFQFHVSAKKPGVGQAALLAQQVAERLKAILTNPDTRYALTERGITTLRPQAVQWVADGDYARRLLACGATLQYPVKFGDLAVNVPSASETPVMFYNEEPLIADEHLIGSRQWSVRAQLLSAKIFAWPPQNTPVVLGLEVAGALTGVTVEIPTGPANVEVEVNAAFDNLIIERNQAVRWRIVSAPVPEDSAWHLSLTLQVQPL